MMDIWDSFFVILKSASEACCFATHPSKVFVGVLPWKNWKIDQCSHSLQKLLENPVNYQYFFLIAVTIFFPFFYQQSDDGCVTYELFYKPEHAKFNQLSQVSFVCLLGYFWGAVIRAWHPCVFGLCCSVRFYYMLCGGKLIVKIRKLCLSHNSHIRNFKHCEVSVVVPVFHTA